MRRPISLDDREDSFADSIIETHDDVVAIRGFNAKQNSEEVHELVLSAVTHSFCTFFGVSPKDRYDDLFDQLAKFATLLSQDHIFADGNKRTTVKTVMAILAMSGIEMDIEDTPEPESNELYGWIQSVVSHEKSTDELADFLRTRAS